MKKRIAAFILFSVIFMSALSGAVFAFPFSEYSIFSIPADTLSCAVTVTVRLAAELVRL